MSTMGGMRTVIGMALLAVVGWTTIGAAQTPNSRRCDTAGDRQFDFFVGDWDVFDRGGTSKAADVRVEKILEVLFHRVGG